MSDLYDQAAIVSSTLVPANKFAPGSLSIIVCEVHVIQKAAQKHLTRAYVTCISGITTRSPVCRITNRDTFNSCAAM